MARLFVIADAFPMSNLLLVEPSATMRNVLASHARSSGCTVSAFADYSSALSHILEQFDNFEQEINCVLLGWPTLPNADAQVLIERLEQPDLADLPVVVMSTDMRAATRAWVAGRDNTAVLHWKHYQRLDSLLDPLLADQSGSGDVFDSKFDNGDIHLLIVDDSVSIRHSLRDLFEMQGYRLTLASGYHEALTLAKDADFDIAVLDFYLQDGSGDQLCRELLNLPDKNELVCTILTGTYADHIIRRALRAGAVECMFKNESSELLLARVDAISRFVRQRKRLHAEGRVVDRVIDATAGRVLVLDKQGSVRYASPEMVRLLGFESRQLFEGEALSRVIELNRLPAPGSAAIAMRWNAADGEPIELNCRVLEDAAAGRIVQVWLDDGSSPLAAVFQRPVPVASQAVSTSPSGVVSSLQTDPTGVATEARPPVVGPGSLPTEAAPFMAQLQACLNGADGAGQPVSLLRIEFYRAASGEHRVSADLSGSLPDDVPDGDNTWRACEAAAVDVVETRLQALVSRPHHLARLKTNVLVMLIHHDSERHAWLLTRHLMRHCNAGIEGATEDAMDDRKLACNGCLVALARHAHLSASAVMTGTERGLALVRPRGVNLALLLDAKRLLPVYTQGVDTGADAAPSTSDQGEPAATELDPSPADPTEADK